jgi:hypothetical protein
MTTETIDAPPEIDLSAFHVCRDTSYENYAKAAQVLATRGLTPEQVAEVALWYNGDLPKGFWDTVSSEARGAILWLCGMGFG